MDWKKYEIYITRHFQKLFPEASIKHNVRRMGLLSKTSRQVDILIKDKMVGFDLSIIVDCKYFNKKVDVKEVESFLSFVRDLKASKGIIITNIGYTEAAQNRAMYDTQDVELRIINFEDLEAFQGFLAIPYSGSHCAVVSAPEGWVIDNNPKGHYLASMYPAGLSQEEAFQEEGFIYVVFSHKNLQCPDFKALISKQEEAITQHYENPKFEYLETISRKDCKSLLRLLDLTKSNETVEYTLFLDFPEVVIFLTLLSPPRKANSYSKKLEWVGEKLIKGRITYKPFRNNIDNDEPSS